MEKCLTSIDIRMQKRHSPRILESMNDMDLLSHNDMREATMLLLLAVHTLYCPVGVPLYLRYICCTASGRGVRTLQLTWLAVQLLWSGQGGNG